MTKKIEPTPDWNYDESMHVPLIRGGPVKEYVNGKGQSQLATVSPVVVDESDTFETINARRRADTKLMLAAPKMYAKLEEIRFAMESALDNSEVLHRPYLRDTVEEINWLLESATHYE